MESLIKDINLNSKDSQGINWKESEQYLNHFDESCMGSEEFLNYCNKMAEEIRKNHRDMYKSSAMQWRQTFFRKLFVQGCDSWRS